MNQSSQYDPRTGEFYLRPDASLYVRFHEEAHRIQHKTNSWPYFFWVRFNGIRLFGYFARLWIEFDALCRARRVMKKAGVWTTAASNEASTMFKTYITAREHRL